MHHIEHALIDLPDSLRSDFRLHNSYPRMKTAAVLLIDNAGPQTDLGSAM